MLTAAFLLENSGLPGPRANLALLQKFMHEGNAANAAECLTFATPEVSNSPEEFAAMCGVLASAWQKRADPEAAFVFLRPFASHASWRIRESVAIAIQELSLGSLQQTLLHLERWASGNPLEQRAVAAGLCEPKLLKNREWAEPVFRLLEAITLPFDHDSKLTEAEKSLRKTLGYGWSVAVAAYPDPGRDSFDKLFSHKGKHIVWIVRENLKKDRLNTMDPAWVSAGRRRIES